MCGECVQAVHANHSPGLDRQTQTTRLLLSSARPHPGYEHVCQRVQAVQRASMCELAPRVCASVDRCEPCLSRIFQFTQWPAVCMGTSCIATLRCAAKRSSVDRGGRGGGVRPPVPCSGGVVIVPLLASLRSWDRSRGACARCRLPAGCIMTSDMHQSTFQCSRLEVSRLELQSSVRDCRNSRLRSIIMEAFKQLRGCGAVVIQFVHVRTRSAGQCRRRREQNFFARLFRSWSFSKRALRVTFQLLTSFRRLRTVHLQHRHGDSIALPVCVCVSVPLIPV